MEKDDKGEEEEEEEENEEVKEGVGFWCNILSGYNEK